MKGFWKRVSSLEIRGIRFREDYNNNFLYNCRLLQRVCDVMRAALVGIIAETASRDDARDKKSLLNISLPPALPAVLS